MSKEPEALRLADMLSNISVPNSLAEQSATELRRLHTLNAELLEALKLALSVLDEVRSETFRLLRNGQKLYAEQKVWNAIFVIKQALADSALDRMAENARELGLDYEPAGGTQVSKVWWDGDKLMAKPIPLADIYQPAPAAPVQEPLATVKESLQVEQLLYDMLDTLPYNSPEYWIDRIKKCYPLYTTPPEAPVQEPVALKVIKGELCYKSQEDDQSFGMWVPVTPQTDLPFVDGTKFYTTPPAAPVQEPVALQMDVIVVNLVREGINKHRARELAEHFIKHTTPFAAQRQWMTLTDEQIDYSIKRGDIVTNERWSLTTLIVVDVNWALSAVAVQLGNDGSIVVWPASSLKKAAHGITGETHD